MQIHVIAIGQKMPDWVTQAWAEYAKRLPRQCRVVLNERPVVKRTKNTNTKAYKIQETRELIRAVPKGAKLFVLDEKGKGWTTKALSQQLDHWLQEGQDIAILIGGPDGLDQNQLSTAVQKWSISPLTLPHALVRIVLVEQLYRAWSLLKGHPYHRD